jgi:predicted membrane channel-forming protein YqfA (hemolysin III family)
MSIWLYLHNESGASLRILTRIHALTLISSAVNIHTHFWGALIAVIAVVLHLLSAFGVDIPALYFITHHSIFYSEALAPIKLASMDKSSWFSTLFGSKPIAASLPMRIGSFVTSPAMTVAPWLMPHQRGNDWKDIAGFSTFLLGSITVLTFSATFHTVVCHSKEVSLHRQRSESY